MQHVNFYLIDCVLGPLTLANADANGELNIDPDDETRLRELFQAHVRPFFDRWSTKYSDKLRLSLAYFLRRPEILRNVLAAQQDLDMPEPSDIRRFFTILWESLFPGQEWREISAARAMENNDMMEMNLVRNPE